jgi:hypothetical protein
MPADVEAHFRDPSILAAKDCRDLERLIQLKLNELEILLKEKYSNLIKVVNFQLRHSNHLYSHLKKVRDEKNLLDAQLSSIKAESQKKDEIIKYLKMQSKSNTDDQVNSNQMRFGADAGVGNEKPFFNFKNNGVQPILNENAYYTPDGVSSNRVSFKTNSFELNNNNFLNGNSQDSPHLPNSLVQQRNDQQTRLSLLTPHTGSQQLPKTQIAQVSSSLPSKNETNQFNDSTRLNETSGAFSGYKTPQAQIGNRQNLARIETGSRITLPGYSNSMLVSATTFDRSYSSSSSHSSYSEKSGALVPSSESDPPKSLTIREKLLLNLRAQKKN